MPIPISHFSVFIVSISLFSNFFITQSSNNINAPLIHKTCNKIAGPTVSFNFCSTSLQFATKPSHCTDVRCLGLVSIGLVRDNVTSTRHHITKLMRNKSHNSFVRSCLGDCLELYSNAISRVEKAVKDYRLKQYVDANVAISTVMSAASTCEDGFKEKKGVRSPLKERNEYATGLGAIVLAIMSLLR